MTNTDTYIVFDIGGTKTRVATAAAGQLGEVETYQTPASPEEGISELLKAAERLLGGFPVAGACGGISGITNAGVLYRIPNLPLWDGTNLGEQLAAKLSAPVTLVNDAELVALGEYFYGAGKGERDMLYVTVSTGVGGAHIVDGKVDKGKYNAEIGHQIVGRGELEDQVSGTAVEKKYGMHPKDLSDESILNELADTLAKGLYDNVLHWSPECIVLGGSMIVGQNAVPIARVEKTLTEMLKQYYPDAPRVKKATLGNNGGLYGGLALLG